MRIIVDAMGGDNAPESAVVGGALAAKEYGEQVVLVGRQQTVEEILQKRGLAGTAGLSIVQADDLVERVHGVLQVGGLLEERDDVEHGDVRLVREGEMRELVDCRDVLGGARERDDVAARRVHAVLALDLRDGA